MALIRTFRNYSKLKINKNILDSVELLPGTGVGDKSGRSSSNINSTFFFPDANLIFITGESLKSAESSVEEEEPPKSLSAVS